MSWHTKLAAAFLAGVLASIASLAAGAWASQRKWDRLTDDWKKDYR